MDNTSTRERLRFSIQSQHLRFHGRDTAIGCDLAIFQSHWRDDCIRLTADNYRGSDCSGYHAYVANRNALSLLHPATPPGVIIDSLLEADDSEWFVSKTSNLTGSMPIIRSLLEQIALMDLVAEEAP